MIKLILALFTLVALLGPAQAASFEARRGLNLDAWTTWPPEAQWSDPNVLLPFPEWRRSVDAVRLKALRDAGFDFLRMPVDPAPLLSPNAEALRPQLMESILESVRLVNGAGLKVVVDLHLMPSGEDHQRGLSAVLADEAEFARYLGLVREVAALIRDEDASMVAFELMNEPIVDCESQHPGFWPERLRRLWAAARAEATRLTLVLGGACFTSAEGLAKLDPAELPDDNLIWTFHSYAPFLLTHQGATWAGDFVLHVTGLPFPLHAVPRAELDAAVEKVRDKIRRDAPLSRRLGLLAYLDEQVAEIDTEAELLRAVGQPFDAVAAWAQRHAIPPGRILLGEFGMIRQEWGNPFVVPAASRAAYVRTVAEEAERRGFAWSVWSYGGAFGVVEEFEGRQAEPDVLDAVRSLAPLD